MICEAMHPELKVYCGRPVGHPTDHVGMIGKIPVVWQNDAADELIVARVVINTVIGVLVTGGVLAIACAALIAAL